MDALTPKTNSIEDSPEVKGSCCASLREWLWVFVVFLILYALTSNRGAQWQDHGRHIYGVVTGQVVHTLGLALSHPLHHYLAKGLVSLRLLEPCLAVTLLSAIAGALAVANVYGCIVTITRNRGAAVLAAASLGLAHTFWKMATLAETYPLSAALLAGECWAVAVFVRSGRSRFLYLALLLNGLGVSNHLLATLTLPALLILVSANVSRGRVSRRNVFIGLAVWIGGASLYFGMVLLAYCREGDLAATIHSALFGERYAANVLNVTLSARTLWVSAAFILLNFPNLVLPAAGYGVVRAESLGVDRGTFRYLLVGLVVHGLFVLRYDVVDQHTFFLPMYVFLAIFAGVGFAAWWRKLPARRKRDQGIAVALLVLTPMLYAIVPSLGRRLNVLGDAEHTKPYRDDYVYLFTPWSIADRSCELLSAHAIELAGENALIVIEDTMAEFAVMYAARRLDREGVEVVRRYATERLLDAMEQRRPVVLVPEDANAPAVEIPFGRWVRSGDLYTLRYPDAR